MINKHRRKALRTTHKNTDKPTIWKLTTRKSVVLRPAGNSQHHHLSRRRNSIATSRITDLKSTLLSIPYPFATPLAWTPSPLLYHQGHLQLVLTPQRSNPRHVPYCSKGFKWKMHKPRTKSSHLLWWGGRYTIWGPSSQQWELPCTGVFNCTTVHSKILTHRRFLTSIGRHSLDPIRIEVPHALVRRQDRAMHVGGFRFVEMSASEQAPCTFGSRLTRHRPPFSIIIILAEIDRRA